MTTKIKSGVIGDNVVGITQLNVSDGTNGQVLTTDGSGTLSFSTISGYTDSDVETYLNTSEIYTDPTNNRLGIGATSPSEKLEVGGNIFINTSGNPNLTVKTTGAGNNPFVRIQADTNYWDLQTLFSNANDELDFRYNGSSKMIIDSSGNVGIGATSPSSALHVSATTAIINLQDSNGSGNAATPFLQYKDSGGTDLGYVGYGSGGNSTLSIVNIANDNIDFLTNGEQRMRITSDLQVKINTPITNDFFGLSLQYNGSDTADFKVNQATGQIKIGGSNTGYYPSFWSNNTERMRITSSGVVHIGGNFTNDGSNEKLTLGDSIGLNADKVIGSGNTYGNTNSSGGYSDLMLYSSATGNASLNMTYAGAQFEIKTPYGGYKIGALNGTYHHHSRISGGSTYYWDNRCEASGGFHTYSDERLKENIVAIDSALDKVVLMNGVTFDWKDPATRGGGDTGKQFGVIAQNMLEVDSELPSLCTDPLAAAGNEETDEKYYTMDYTRITPFLIEAIKELKLELDAAKARIETLEG